MVCFAIITKLLSQVSLRERERERERESVSAVGENEFVNTIYYM